MNVKKQIEIAVSIHVPGFANSAQALAPTPVKRTISQTAARVTDGNWSSGLSISNLYAIGLRRAN